MEPPPIIANEDTPSAPILVAMLRPSVAAPTKSVVVDAFIAFLVASSALYTLNPNESAIVLRLGRIQSIETEADLHTRVPFIDSTTFVYTGDILYDIPTSDVITSDKKSMIADDNKEAVYERMISEREYIAASYTAKGEATRFALIFSNSSNLIHD